MRVLLVLSEGMTGHDQLSDITLARCGRALALWRTGKYNYLLVTGGKFLPPEIQNRPIADVMRDWFIQNGIHDEYIIVEDESVDTYENISFSLALLRERGLKANDEITVCTQMQHAWRAAITFWRAHGMRVHLEYVRQPTMPWADVLKELLLLVPYHLWDWDGNGTVAANNRMARRRAATSV